MRRFESGPRLHFSRNAFSESVLHAIGEERVVSIGVRNIVKRFGDFTALDNVSLEIPGNDLVALVGPSGSGKTTLLRIIAGLEAADSGTILFEGEDATERHARERQVGFVFQHYALFRHMTVFENVAFGLRVKPRKQRPQEAVIQARVKQLLRLVQLEWLGSRYPSQLSGGQRQRIALARALAVEPKVLLLDEPFGSLDAKVRKELRRWLRRLHDEVHITSLFVTHDQEEALEVADTVVIMNEGRIEQIGSPEEVYQRPANPFVYGFLGDVNLFHGRVQQGQAHIEGQNIPVPEFTKTPDAPVVAFVRPHQIDLQPSSNGKDGIAAVVKDVRNLGPIVRLDLVQQSTGERVVAELPQNRFAELKFQVGQVVVMGLRDPRIFLKEGSNWERAWLSGAGRTD
jgi:sulfate/thiosulfate transport system ATP-binding protein